MNDKGLILDDIGRLLDLDPGRPDFCARCGSPMVVQRRDDWPRPTCPRCGWIYYAKNATGAAALVEQDGALLLVQRKHDPYLGWWNLPAGFVEYGESAEETAVREAREEAGIEVRLTGLWGVYFGVDDPRNAAHLIAYSATMVDGTPTAGDDAAAVAFFPPDGLPEQIAFAGQRAAIREWVARRKAGQSSG